jgi:ABC-type tungstate transport system substrate-binding protein
MLRHGAANFGSIGFIHSVLSWKTRLGKIALGLSLGMILLIASVMLIVGHK